MNPDNKTKPVDTRNAVPSGCFKTDWCNRRCERGTGGCYVSHDSYLDNIEGLKRNCLIQQFMRDNPNEKVCMIACPCPLCSVQC